MSLSTLSNNNFVNYFINLGSERIGLYISFFLHCLILLFAIGLPNFFWAITNYSSKHYTNRNRKYFRSHFNIKRN